jgi:CheY-like chemotaxis protein
MTNGLASAYARLAGILVHRQGAGSESVPRVLVVDDEEPIRNFVSRVLRSAGFHTATASDGPEALQVAATESFNVLLTDLMMPHMNGDELARRLRANDRALKVLYFTGHSDRLFAERLLLWEDEAFLDKPCTTTGLLEAVSLIIGGRTDMADRLGSTHRCPSATRV